MLSILIATQAAPIVDHGSPHAKLAPQADLNLDWVEAHVSLTSMCGPSCPWTMIAEHESSHSHSCGARVTHRARKSFGGNFTLACAEVAKNWPITCGGCDPDFVVAPSPPNAPPTSPFPPPIGALHDGAIRVLSQSTYCLNVNEGDLVESAKLILYPCSSPLHDNEKFVYSAIDHTIRVAEKPELCVNAFGGTLNPADVVGLWTCSGADNEQWVFANNQFRVKSKPEMCINADGGVKNSTDIILGHCGSEENMAWAI